MPVKEHGFVVLILIVALLYSISPIDVISDPLPVVGWVDGLALGLGSGNKLLLVKVLPRLADDTRRLTGLDVFF